jgi:hypothetical protein
MFTWVNLCRYNVAGGLLLHSHTGRHESGGTAAAAPPPPIKGVTNLPLRWGLYTAVLLNSELDPLA